MWGAPSLAQNREIIRRCAGLAVYVEQACIGPCVYACARDSDWNVAFDDYAFAVCVVAHGLQLLVQMVLGEVYDVCFIGSLFGQFFTKSLEYLAYLSHCEKSAVPNRSRKTQKAA